MRIAMIMVIIGSMGGVALSDPAPHEPHEPTVTREESAWLEEAASVAATNVTAAITALEARRGEQVSAAVDYVIGNLHYQAGNEEEARAAYKEALRKMPAFRSARVNLARLYLLGDEPQEAMPLLRDIAEEGTGDADTYLLLGHALLLTDAFVSAESAYRQSLMLRPRDMDALSGLLRALLPQGRVEEILSLTRELLELEPDRAELWSVQANALIELERYDEAAAALDSARRLGVADADMLATLGDLHLDGGRPEDAMAMYTLAFAGDQPSVSRMLRAAENFILLDEEEGAERMVLALEEIRRAEPSRVEGDAYRTLLRIQGDLALLRGDDEQALDRFQALLREDPLNGRVLLRVADLYRVSDRLEEAVLMCERAARVSAVQREAYMLQGQIEVQREAYARAVPLLESAYALEASDTLLRYLEQVRRLRDLAAQRD
jgi:tetratricopeptide (TPR) repeat protein